MAPQKQQKKKSRDFDLDREIALYDTKPTLHQRILYGLSGFFVAALTVYPYHTVVDVDFFSYWPVYIVVTLAAAAGLALSYETTTSFLTHKIFKERGLFSASDDKKVRAQQESIRTEAFSFSILYNNVYFLFGVLLIGFFMFAHLLPVYNYILTVGFSVTWVYFASTTN
eukprot:TRINITY_DN2029_c0_g1_i2.p1 TRINITY_DN2029_c0_g1~~TRINITY_DN2029_c0_g1_i2.p1  ORF type:complete len:189 (-),score=52.80 TRINITY_DN2029_c0_g1_i2:159-665(-)